LSDAGRDAHSNEPPAFRLLAALKAEWLGGGEVDGWNLACRPEEIIMASVANTVKEKARQLLGKLPENATWDDVVYELAVHRSIKRGMNDADARRLSDISDVLREFGLE